MNGNGKFYWKDREYDGEWKDNCLNGFGILRTVGRIYVGNFVFDKKSGLGMHIISDSIVPDKKPEDEYKERQQIQQYYISNFVNDMAEGITIIIDENKKKSIGISKNDKVVTTISNEEEVKKITQTKEYQIMLDFYEKYLVILDSMNKENK